MPRAHFCISLVAVAILAAFHPAAGQEADELFARWSRTRDPQARALLSDDVVHAAVMEGRPDIVEEIAANGRLMRREIGFPRRARRVALREVMTFDGIKTSLGQEDGYFSYDGETALGWLVRRITREAWEVWTPTHGWLLDGNGRVLNEAQPARGDGTGREWFGAFLPDGRWVTTDLEDMDCALTFFSRDSQRLRQMTSAELAPPGPYHPGRALLGWARSDKEGAAWIVNVGSEQGYATVRVGPEGPARVLGGIERWQLCYPRALGPRGFYIDMGVPDDSGELLLARTEAGHGVGVGFPFYELDATADYSLEADHPGRSSETLTAKLPAGVRLPDGNRVFGFWPGRPDVFIGTETTVEDKGRKRQVYGNAEWVVDKTWFFDRRWQLQGWARARRLADSADGRSLLLRADDDSRVVTLRPDLRAAAVRRFVWPGGATADAVTLFDDLRLGLFVRGGRLVLAGW